jgi:DNA-binding NtrC family response regulator
VANAVRKRKFRTILLNIGIDSRYLARRREILAGAGFNVLDALSVKDALAIAKDHPVSVAIFGHRIAAADRLQISDELKRKNPKIRLVVMYDHSVSRTESADAVLRVDVAPDDLIHTVEYLLSIGGSSTAAPANG